MKKYLRKCTMDDFNVLRELDIGTYYETFAHLNTKEDPSQTDVNDEKSLEIERIYIASDFQEKGLGNYLMEKAISVASKRNKQYLWLGVWEKNEKAICFYKKNGFFEVGTHSFFMGDDEQTDYIMRKDLL